MTTWTVDPTRGQDQGNGSPAGRFLRTLTYALSLAHSGDRIDLRPGRYTPANGEKFPLIVGTGVVVLGDESRYGEGVVIAGGGSYPSSLFGTQSVGMVLQGTAELRGVTLTHDGERGTGSWIEQGRPIVQHCRVQHCSQDGIFVTGTALPLIADNIISQNKAAGIHLTRQAKGEVRRNRCTQTGIGIAISDDSAPLLSDNVIQQNPTGILCNRLAQPVLRQNQVEGNHRDGLRIQDAALPDLGQPQDLGRNLIQNNGRSQAGADLRNDTARALVSVGNQLNPIYVVGQVTYAPSQLPDPVAVPPLTAGSATLPTPERPDPPAPPPGSSRFKDVPNHWSAGFINALVGKNLVQGFPDGSFRPEETVTRAQFAAIAIASFPNNATVNPYPRRFNDVPRDFWAAAAIEQAQRQGFLQGFPDGSFRPNQAMSRIEAIVALVNGLQLGSSATDAIGIYQDRAQIPSYAVDRLATATKQRLVVNYPDPLRLRPMEALRRGELAALIYQSLVTLGKAALLPSPYIVRPDTTVPSFSDIPHHWAADFIQGMVQANLVQGYGDGSFRPDAPITRAQYASLLVKAFDPEPRRDRQVFRDVPADHWAATAIDRACRGGFLSGFPDQTFGPDQGVLRVQVLVSLVTGLNLAESGQVSTADQAKVLKFYADRDQIPAYSHLAVAQATQLGLVVNFPEPKQLHANDAATRAEVVAMVYQGLVIQERLPKIPSPYQVLLTQ
jgi:parallel beta-helix repeat protein